MAFVSARDLQIPVEAWETGVPGLIITAVPVTEAEKGYRVTHENSGYAITMMIFPSIDIACVFAQDAKEIRDWTMKLEELSVPDRDELREKLKERAEKFVEVLSNNPEPILRRAIEIGKDV